MASTPIFTFQDMVELVWEVMNTSVKPPTGRELRLAKQAVITAYRDMANRHPWNYYKRRAIITTDASYSTGTVVFDYTGGASERLLTLTSGVFPANAAKGVIVISNKHYRVETRLSDTTVTLDANVNPGADVASTAYEWYREAYPLPVDFRRLCEHPIESTSGGNAYPLTYVTPGSELHNKRYESGSTTSDPDWYTIRNADDYLGSLSLVFGRAPNTAKTYDIMYEVAPRELRTYKYAAGTMTLAADAVAVTGNSTTFTAFHAGAILRVTESTATEPTTVMGNVNGDDNPYFAQRMILSVASTTSLTIDAIVSSATTLTTTKYVISDPIDIEPIVMRSYFEALCLASFARLTKRKDMREYMVASEHELALAQEQDNRVAIVSSGALQDHPVSNQWGSVDSIP